ncbi:amino acid adenylation domain-containing protein [Aestuariispira insulae]|uniref:Amino acid adenylation domain-containing protein n=1 Tax=Aestuariispira insulae TaxID=1461337 RepID=A0A3D9H3W4_9PROT|nr:amino acid adenylation domain-containing protein [Aestuariispira insulae]RED44184.1 amino acid adenylation domain-containing protein [Aestuariispira insulae]
MTDIAGIPRLAEAFIKHAADEPARTALVLGGRSFSYGDLDALSNRIANRIHLETGGRNLACALFTGRSLHGFAAILACFKAGAFYAPFPVRDLAANHRDAFGQLAPALCLADRSGLKALCELLAEDAAPHTVLLLDLAELPENMSLPERHRVIGSNSIDQMAAVFDPVACGPDALAYLMFTSGSTGKPKGVPVSHGNLHAYLDGISEVMPVRREDRCTQLFELTFDLSVHDYAVTWCAGAALHVPDGEKILTLPDMVRDQGITVWFSVPSVIALMDQFHQMKPDGYPGLRLAAFCGEALPSNLVRTFAEAAPGAELFNLYGPTEATIAFTGYRIETIGEGIEPIGRPLAGQEALIIGPDGRECEVGEMGELCLTGRQVVAGYWLAEQETGRCFEEAENGDILYHSGDLAHRDENGCLHFHGRLDDQVKIRGYRVELAAIDAVLSELAGGCRVMSLAWPPDRLGNPTGVIAYCEGTGIDGEALIARCENHLPAYLVPKKIYSLDQLPMNRNGKLDRKALLARHEERNG